MNSYRTRLIYCLGCVPFLLMVLVFPDAVHARKSARTRVSNAQQPGLVSIVPPGSAKDWVKQQLLKGEPLLLTNSYLFQVMKGVSQENQKRTEETALIPLLEAILQALSKASSDDNSRRLFGVALALLVEKPDVSPEAVKEAQEIKSNPMFSPRGHYTESEALQRYFVAMQYLAKATVDVSVKKALFPFPENMLFPFETVQAIQTLFSDPKNKHSVIGWMLVDEFYSEINGDSDLPTFSSLTKISEAANLTKGAVEQWATARKLPKINVERGLGIQPFGERASLHEFVIDDTKSRFMSDDKTRDKIAEMLRFENLLKGKTVANNKIKGLDERIRLQDDDTYYMSVLRTVSQGAKGWETDRSKQNFFAACTTSLAEQTALMAKVSILVQKSARVEKQAPERVKVYLEPDSEKFLADLSKASGRMFAICSRTAHVALGDRSGDAALLNISPVFDALSKFARESKSVEISDDFWKEHGVHLAELSRKPAVTVDVFQLKDRSGNTYYFQWAIAPFEMLRSIGKKGAKAKGMEMVFFEAWNDEIVPGSQGPINNLQWEGRTLEGNLNNLHPLIRVPN